MHMVFVDINKVQRSQKSKNFGTLKKFKAVKQGLGVKNNFASGYTQGTDVKSYQVDFLVRNSYKTPGCFLNGLSEIQKRHWVIHRGAIS